MPAGKKIILREKKISDMSHDYTWRCDPELSSYDGVPPLKMSYQEYALYYAWDLHNGDRIRRWFAIDSVDGNGNKHIGNCMYYDVDKDRKQSKLGIMIGDREYWDRGYGADAVNTLVSHIFESTDINRIYLDTLEWNIRAQHCFQKCGFVVCGRVSRRGNEFLIMELHRSCLQESEPDT